MGVEGFSNVLRHELVGTNIRVLINRPGTVRTEFHSRRHMYDPEKTEATYAGACPLVAQDIAVGCLYQCLQPERISIVMLEMLGTAQRSLFSCDKQYEARNGVNPCDDWEK
jgi:NADP-dependent 3-hydroxy acid dehydrogenase YdfG